MADTPAVYEGLPAAGVGFPMFGPESFACLSVKINKKPWETGMVKDRRGNSHELCSAYGVSKEKPFVLRLRTGDTPSQDAQGATISVPESGDALTLNLASHLPLSAPIYHFKKAKPAGPVLIFPETYIVDLCTRRRYRTHARLPQSRKGHMLRQRMHAYTQTCQTTCVPPLAREQTSRLTA